MKIFPAIDLIDGKVVRLTKGNYNKITEYDISPEKTALDFYNKGARYLHVVDLDGAKEGRAVNAKIIQNILKNKKMFVEVGGGIRTFEQIENYLDCGAARVILGTAAINDFDFLQKCIYKYGDKISVGVDAKNNKVAVNGWEKITANDSVKFCRTLEAMGVKSIIYTDISKDGALNGTNLSIYEVLCQTKQVKFTASGGITFLEELQKLAKIGLDAAIIGKAIYEGVINLEQAIKLSEV